MEIRIIIFQIKNKYDASRDRPAHVIGKANKGPFRSRTDKQTMFPEQSRTVEPIPYL